MRETDRYEHLTEERLRQVANDPQHKVTNIAVTARALQTDRDHAQTKFLDFVSKRLPT